MKSYKLLKLKIEYSEKKEGGRGGKVQWILVQDRRAILFYHFHAILLRPSERCP
jgi:hypothetical protein